MTKIQLNLEPRVIQGKKTSSLRQKGILPANIYGSRLDSLSVQVKASDFVSTFNRAGETQIVYLNVKGEDKERPVLISEVQQDFVNDKIIHVDFHQVNLKEKVTANIPVEIIGTSPAVKDLNGSLVTFLDEIEVEALPTDLLEKFTVDISVLAQIGDSVKVSDLRVDSGKIEIKVDLDSPIVSVVGQQTEEEVVPTSAEAETDSSAQTETAEAPKEDPAKS